MSLFVMLTWFAIRLGTGRCVDGGGCGAGEGIITRQSMGGRDHLFLSDSPIGWQLGIRPIIVPDRAKGASASTG